MRGRPGRKIFTGSRGIIKAMSHNFDRGQNSSAIFYLNIEWTLKGVQEMLSLSDQHGHTLMSKLSNLFDMYRACGPSVRLFCTPSGNWALCTD